MTHIYDGSRDSTNFVSESFLDVNSVGTQIMPKGSVTVRRQGRVDYHIFLVLDGKYTVSFGGEEHILTAGGLALYYPGEAQRYEALVTSKSFWLHFSGEALEGILKSEKLPSGIYKASEKVTTEAFKLLSLFGTGNKRHSRAALLKLIYTLSDCVGDKKSGIPPEIFSAVAYVNSNYDKEISLDALAKISGYSKSRFSHLFAESMSTSPLKYQNGLRLKNAAEMLLSSTAPVGEIASLVGFSDQLYFTRLFTREFGISPTEYRKRPNDEN